MNKQSQPATRRDFGQLREVKDFSPAAHTSDADYLIKLFLIVWYRKAMLICTVTLLTLMSGIVIFQLTPLYSAKTVLMIEPGLPSVETSNSVIEVIRSRRLADQVIDSLGLDQNPEFNSALQTPGPLQTLINKFTGKLKSANTADNSRHRQERAKMIDRFLKKLEVSSVRRSYIVNIVFESENPQTAALVVNKLAELYIFQQLVSKIEITEQAALWLQERVMSSNNGEDSLVDVLDSTLIRSLRAQEADIARTIANLSLEHGEGHPKMMNARAELREIRARIKNEVSKIVKGVENEARIASNHRTTLERLLESLRRSAENSNSAEAFLETESNRTLLNKLLSRIRETEIRNDRRSQRIDVRIVSSTDTPASNDPIYPKKRLLLSFAFMTSLFFGLSIIFATEFFNRGFKSSEEFEQSTGIPNLGLIPKVSRFELLKQPQNEILKQPKSAFAVSIRTLYTSILFSRLGRPCKRILITSALIKEGKTTIATCLVRSMAKSGHNVLLIDADLQRPAVHKVLRIPREPGLVDMLLNDTAREDVVQKDVETGAHVITAGCSASDPTTLLCSDRMISLLDDFGKSYDMVVLDSPPILHVPDAGILSRRVDQTLLITCWAKTSQEAVISALRLLRNSSSRPISSLLTMVDMRRGFPGHHRKMVRNFYRG